ncbi:MAG TPA: hypothetical protein VKB51_12715 [bacterium]|nr:hypothetical protein [bacterium]
MIAQFALLWRFLQAQPWTQYVGLASWHLMLLLFVLGVLSAFGLHFLVGHIFRFYRRKERLARWVAWPTLLVFLASVQLLLAAYLLGVRAPELVRANLTAGVTTELGRLLLAPAFKNPTLAAQSPESVAKAAINTALRSSSELEYRDQLVAELVPPSELKPVAGSPSGPRGPDVLVQIGLRWVTEPHSGWLGPEVKAKPKANAQEDSPFFLPDFLWSLIDELPDGTVLPRLDWEHVAGTRYVETVLRPLAEEYLSYLAALIALVVVVVDGLFFLLMGRLKRIGRPRPAKKPPAPKTTPAPAKGASPAPPPKAASPAETKSAPDQPAAEGANVPAVSSGTASATQQDAPPADADKASG